MDMVLTFNWPMVKDSVERSPEKIKVSNLKLESSSAPVVAITSCMVRYVAHCKHPWRLDSLADSSRVVL